MNKIASNYFLAIFLQNQLSKIMIRSFKHIVKTDLIFKSFFSFGVIKFNLPDLGEKIKEGTIKKLYIKEGDRVQEFQKLADVASDKQFTQITASDSGIIKKIHYQEEDVCQVGNLFLQIEVSDGTAQKVEQIKSIDNNIHGQKSSSAPVNNNATQSRRSIAAQILATPYVRGLIKQYNLSINQIEGSGPQGRILESDVLAIVQGKKQSKRVPSIQFGKKFKPQQEKKPQQKQKQTAKATSGSKNLLFSTQQSSEVKKMTLFEKGMQKSMTVANTIPHLYYHEQIDLTECEKLRKTLKASNKKVTVMGLLIKTFSMALKKYPRINSTYSPDLNQFQYKTHHNHNISVAIDSPNGLVVPNIKNVQTLSLLNIQDQLQRLRKLSVEAKLTGSELNNGTVCISNIGTIGGIMANPLILPPQICIVAIGKLQTVAKWRDNQWVPRNVINVSFGCDHRIIDGATVARFSNEWKALLQNPYVAMAEMI